MVVTLPDSISICLISSAAKNPSLRPSGDQNGKVASTVPGNGRAAPDPTGFSQRCLRPSWRPSTDSVSPSGERATEASLVGGVPATEMSAARQALPRPAPRTDTIKRTKNRRIILYSLFELAFAAHDTTNVCECAKADHARMLIG